MPLNTKKEIGTNRAINRPLNGDRILYSFSTYPSLCSTVCSHKRQLPEHSASAHDSVVCLAGDRTLCNLIMDGIVLDKNPNRLVCWRIVLD